MVGMITFLNWRSPHKVARSRSTRYFAAEAGRTCTYRSCDALLEERQNIPKTSADRSRVHPIARFELFALPLLQGRSSFTFLAAMLRALVILATAIPFSG